MDLKRKLANLTSAGPGSRAPIAPTQPDAPPAPSAPANDASASVPQGETDAARAERIAALRGQIHAIMARSAARTPPRPTLEARTAALPFVRDEHDVFLRSHVYAVTQRHGAVPLHTALAALPASIAALALDPALERFDPATALYLDTETTGLSGGAGTLAFLIGVARFDGQKFKVEQFFLADPSAERPMLVQLAERIASASALVTYNGKAFDMPLLRSRFVMARVEAPREPPHFDLVHVARRIYADRLPGCKLTTLERDVLGFVREADVPSGEIPSRYADFLRTGNAEPLLAVIDHNLWDVIAMAALVGELSARIAGLEASGRFDASDMAGLARSVLRAGREERAVALAADAARTGVAFGQTEVAVRANHFAAQIHRRKRDHGESLRLLLEALALEPDDATLHLSLSKLYEHRLGDPARALDHARRALAAEEAASNARRVARLEARVAKKPAGKRRRSKPVEGETLWSDVKDRTAR